MKKLFPSLGTLPNLPNLSKGPPPAAEPIAFTVLDPYNNQTNLAAAAAPTAYSQGTPIPGFGPNGALDVAMNGVVTTLSVTRNSTPWTQVGANDLLLVGIRPPVDPVDGNIGSLVLNINATYQMRSNTGEPAAGGLGARFGARWASMSAASVRDGSWAGSGLDALSVSSTGVRVQTGPDNIAGPGTTKIGPIIRITQRRKSILCMTFDDNYRRELIDIIPLMQTKLGFAVGTSYIGMGLLGSTGDSLTLSDLAAMKAAAPNWKFCLNSGPNDQPIWAGAHDGTMAGAIAELNTQKAALMATTYATADDASHICYSYGSSGFVETIVNSFSNLVSTGTNEFTSVTANAFFNTHCVPGTVLRGPSIPAGTTVVSVPAINRIVVDRIITAGTYTASLCHTSALTTNGTLLANGTTTISNIRTHNLAPGMVMQGRDVPAGTTIVSINTESGTFPTGTTADGTITVSQNVPSTCTRAGFYFAGKPWLSGRVETALIAAGYKSARRIHADGRICTQMGIPSAEAMMSLWGLSLDAASSSTIPALTQAVRDGRDVVSYCHAAPAFNLTEFGLFLDAVRARMDAGELDVMSVPAWYNRVAARSGL